MSWRRPSPPEPTRWPEREATGHTFIIEAIGQEYVVELNGVEVSRYTGDGSRGLEGYVGLQNYPSPAGAEVEFRNIWVQELDGDPGAPSVEASLDPAEPDGEDGWYTSPVSLSLASDTPEADLQWRAAGDDEWTAWTEPVVFDQDGEHTIEYQAIAEGGAEPGTADVTVGPSSAWTFDPDELTVQQGDTVRYTLDSGFHNVVITDDRGNEVATSGPPSASWDGPFEFTASEPGTFYYYCTPHAGTGAPDPADWTGMVGRLEVEPTSGAGGSSEIGEVSFQLDQTTPATTAELDGEQDGDEFTGPVTVTLTGDDATSGVAETHYRMAGDPDHTVYEGPLTIDQEGDHTVEFRTVDVAGNVEDWQSIDLTIAGEDPAPCPEPTAPPPGWRSLFDGETLDGWSQAGPGGFEVTECGTLEEFGGMGLGWYDQETFGDFRLRVDWKVQQATDNSGVFLRFPDPGDDPWVAVNQGYEIQIADSETAPTSRTGSVYTFSPADPLASNPPGEWNTFIIEAIGQEYVVELNGVEVSRYTGDGSRGLEGYVGIQNHLSSPEAGVEFRNIWVQDLDEEVDTTPPTVSAELDGETDDDGAYVGSVTATVNAMDEDDGSGIASVEYMLGSDQWMAYDGPVTVSEPGEYVMEFRATDVAENVSDVGSVEFTVVDEDDGGPGEPGEPGRRGRRVLLVLPVLPVRRDRQGATARTARTARTAATVVTVVTVGMAVTGATARRDRRVRAGRPARRVLPVRRVRPDRRGRPARRVRRVRPVAVRAAPGSARRARV